MTSDIEIQIRSIRKRCNDSGVDPIKAQKVQSDIDDKEHPNRISQTCDAKESKKVR